MSKRGSQQDYLITINNPKAQLDFRPHGELVCFAIWQLERGERGTPHFQLYIEFAKSTSIVRGAKLLALVGHWEARRGTQLEAVQYCSKLLTRLEGPWTFGAPRATGQGARTDLNDLAQRVADGQSGASVAREAPALFVRYHRGISALEQAVHRPAWRDVKCFYLAGLAGTGKTSLVYDTFGTANVYCLASEEPLWADGYAGQSVLLLDDLAQFAQRKVYLRWLDGHPLQLPVKGGYVWARFTVVCVCTNEWEVPYFSEALLRRFAHPGGIFWVGGRRGQHDRLGQFMRGGGERPRGYERPDGGKRITDNYRIMEDGVVRRG